MTTKILYQGQVFDPSGYAVAGRGYLYSMIDYIKANNLDIDLKMVAASADQAQTLTRAELDFLESLQFKTVEELRDWTADEDYHYIFHHPPIYAAKLDMTKDLAACSKSTTCFTVWETDEIPPIWNDIFERYDVDKIVVPCEWNRESFTKSLKKYQREIPVIAVPHLINDDFIEQDRVNDEGMEQVVEAMQKDTFNVLTVGQWTDRKALMNVVKAFLMEFKSQDNCQLYVKTYGNIQDPRPEMQQHQQQMIAHEITALKNSILGNDIQKRPECKLHLLYGLYPKEQLNYLYQNSDLFALFSRAEGFGLPIAEAIGNGTPVIVHDKGGHVDFVDPDSNFIVDCFSTPSHCTIFPFVYSCDTNWFETDFHSARKQFRAAYDEWENDRTAFAKRGEQAKKHMLKITGDSVSLGEQLVNFVLEEHEQQWSIAF